MNQICCKDWEINTPKVDAGFVMSDVLGHGLMKNDLVRNAIELTINQQRTKWQNTLHVKSVVT